MNSNNNSNNKNIRLSDYEIESVKYLFSKYFLKKDRIWVFGSRANINRKGGDIDFYIETYKKDVDDAIDSQIKFISDLENKIGEQKIDVVLNILESSYTTPIYYIAKNTGIQIIK